MAGSNPRQRVLVAMSGGVDSSVAAALLQEAGYDVAGVTMKLWGGPSDTGCCSVSDVDDARWVADQLGLQHHVFNFGDDFDRHVVAPYVADHAAGRTPNPCVECNRHLKFDRLVRRAEALGFDMVATGHHARVAATDDGPRIARGADAAKDQSYVLHMLAEAVLGPVAAASGGDDQARGAATGPRRGAWSPRPSLTARTSASSLRRRGARGSSASASPCGPGGWWTPRAVPSERSSRSSW